MLFRVSWFDFEYNGADVKTGGFIICRINAPAFGRDAVMTAALRIGSRGSPLALVQSRQVKDALCQLCSLDARDIEIVTIETSADRFIDRKLADIGGKGLFTKEIEAALRDQHIDLAVHSLKDVPTFPEGGDDLILSAMLVREDPRDAFISLVAARLADLPQGAVVGTSSIRRQAQLLHQRPDLRVVPFRGNVGTRLEKLKAGAADGTFLALAGLKRLGRASEATQILEPEEMLPAVCQGIVAIQCRADDDRIRTLTDALNHPETALCATAERALLAQLDGTCQTPIAALASLEKDDVLYLRALALSPDGVHRYWADARGPAAAPEALGTELGAELIRQAGVAFFKELG